MTKGLFVTCLGLGLHGDLKNLFFSFFESLRCLCVAVSSEKEDLFRKARVSKTSSRSPRSSTPSLFLLVLLYSNFIDVKWEKETLSRDEISGQSSSKNSLIFHRIFYREKAI